MKADWLFAIMVNGYGEYDDLKIKIFMSNSVSDAINIRFGMRVRSRNDNAIYRKC